MEATLTAIYLINRYTNNFLISQEAFTNLEAAKNFVRKTFPELKYFYSRTIHGRLNISYADDNKTILLEIIELPLRESS